MIKTSEAATRYGISGSRIRKLIQDGKISAERVGKIWYVDEQSLAEHLNNATPGRPAGKRLNGAGGPGLREYTLMSRGHEVAHCAYDPQKRCFVRFELIDEDRVPLAVKTYKAQDGMRAAFNSWWKHRAVPESRDFMANRLRELELSSTFEIPLRSLGLSLSDQYWLRPVGSAATWSQVSFFKNEFDLGPVDDEGRPVSSESEWTNSVGLHSPDNTTDGMLRKRWLLDESGRRVLIKGSGQSGREAYNEVIATMLYRRLLPSSRYVEYTLGQWRGQDVCVCETFLRDDEEFIPAWQVFNLKKKRNNHSEYRHYVEACAELGAEDAWRQLDRILVCDSILANIDRHWGNFGLIRNVETLEYRTAPIFDTGSSLWVNQTIRSMAAGDYRFETRPFYKQPKRQLDMVIDASWYHPEALDGFVEEVREYLTKVLLRDQAEVICKGLEQRIDAVNSWARQAPTSKFSQDMIGNPERLVQVWL